MEGFAMSISNKIAKDLVTFILFIAWTGIILIIGFEIGVESTLGKIKRGELAPKSTVVVVSTNITWEVKK